MAGLFNAVVSAGKSALDRMQGGTDPNVVRSIRPSDFDPVPIQDREDCMMLHGPRTLTVKKEQLIFYDIIVHSEKNTAFR